MPLSSARDLEPPHYASFPRRRPGPGPVPLLRCGLRAGDEAPHGGGRQPGALDGPRRPPPPLLPGPGLRQGGHQRDPADFALLRQRALAPLPLQQRRAALEGLAVGLAAWPAAPLRQTLRHLIGDLDPALAATAVDLLARLPGGSADLAGLDRGRLAPELARRVERRLAGAAPVTAAG